MKSPVQNLLYFLLWVIVALYVFVILISVVSCKTVQHRPRYTRQYDLPR